MNNQSINKLIKEVGDFAEYNFDVHDPLLGVAEELGEYAHAVLKLKQNIRKVDPNAIKDAIGDSFIFLFHFCHIAKIKIAVRNFSVSPADRKAAFRRCLRHLSRIMSYNDKGLSYDGRCHSHVSDLFDQLCLLAFHNDLYPSDCIDHAWMEVKDRDFRKFPLTGKPECQISTSLPK